MNHITLLGRLTQEVHLSQANHTEYTRFSIAVDRNRSDGVNFINCVCFGKLAEALSNNCEKGRQILVFGRLQMSSNKGRTYYSVVASEITFLQRPRRNQSNQNTKDSSQGKTKKVNADEVPF